MQVHLNGQTLTKHPYHHHSHISIHLFLFIFDHRHGNFHLKYVPTQWWLKKYIYHHQINEAKEKHCLYWRIPSKFCFHHFSNSSYIYLLVIFAFIEVWKIIEMWERLWAENKKLLKTFAHPRWPTKNCCTPLLNIVDKLESYVTISETMSSFNSIYIFQYIIVRDILNLFVSDKLHAWYKT